MNGIAHIGRSALAHADDSVQPIIFRRGGLEERRHAEIVLASIDRIANLRIPVKATMDSDAWRPLDPVDDDQGGA